MKSKIENSLSGRVIQTQKGMVACRYVQSSVIVLLALFVCLTAPQNCLGDYIIVKEGPKKTGTKFVTVTTSDGKRHDISVPVTAGETTDDVTSAIIRELNANGITATEGVLGLTTGVRVSGTVNEIVSDKGGETDTLADAGVGIGPVLAATGLGGTMAGLDSLGDPSSFTAGFDLSSAALGDVAISATVYASQFVGTPTVREVLQQEYNNLSSQLEIYAPSLAGDLSLDLPDSQILFAMPAGLTLAEVTGGTTDVSGTSSAAWVTPEPSYFALLLVGVGLFAAHRWRAARPPNRLHTE